jgi:hypothetical protein
VSEKRICGNPECSAEFEPVRAWQIFCQASCRGRQHFIRSLRKTRPAKADVNGSAVCSNPKCGKSFESSRAWQRFCSPACKREEWRSRHLRRRPLKCARNESKRIKANNGRVYSRRVVVVGSMAGMLRTLARHSPEFYLRLIESVRKAEQAPVAIPAPSISNVELQPLDFPSLERLTSSAWGGE